MDQETAALVQRWILTFLEQPPLIDAELMRHVLAEHDNRVAEPSS
ncbi:MAG TPA: hypothetical protein VF633_04680 [Brevundimonas sp.]|jgi:hypothetical protein